MKQYFVMRYRKKHKDWVVCGMPHDMFMSSFDAQRMLHNMRKKFPKQVYELGVKV